MIKNLGLMIVFFVTLLIVVVVSVVTFLPFDIRENLIHHFRPLHPAPSATSSISIAPPDVVIDAPVSGASISSPLTIVGSARGTWYFEASFPVEILDAKGTVVGQGSAQAGDNWMTTDFVPFTAIIEFTPQPHGTKGTIVLMKDDPSGDPTKEASTTLSIIF